MASIDDERSAHLVATVEGEADAPLATQAVRRSLARREAATTDEVRRLLDAGLAVMRRCGTRESPRVSDIVKEAGLSNQAFYRHFTGKDELVAAILDDGNHRMLSYLGHQMSKEDQPVQQIRQWVEGVMRQATDLEVAETTRAVHWNGRQLPEELTSKVHPATQKMRDLLEDPLALLGSIDPRRDARAISHAATGTLNEFLERRATPERRDVDHLVALCLRSVSRAGER